MYGIAGGGRLVLILDVIIASESVVRETKIIRKKFAITYTICLAQHDGDNKICRNARILKFSFLINDIN